MAISAAGLGSGLDVNSIVSQLMELEQQVDKIYCLATPVPFYAIGAHYDHFPQVSDEEVIDWLRLCS